MIGVRILSVFPQSAEIFDITRYFSLGNVATAQQTQAQQKPPITPVANAVKNIAKTGGGLGELDTQLKQFIGADEESKKKREEDIDRIFKGYQDYIDLAPSEVRILYELTERRLKLDQREQNIKEQEAALEAINKRLQERNKVMEDLNFELKKQLGILDNTLEAERKKIRDLYANMKPIEAAIIWNNMDADTLTLIITGMPARVTGPIMGKMNPDKVLKITQAMAESNRKNLIEKLRKKETDEKSKAELEKLAKEFDTKPTAGTAPVKKP